MNIDRLKLHFHVEGRNGYYAIDEYLNEKGDQYSGCIQMVEIFKTKKLATSVCRTLNGLAYEINKLKGLTD